MLFRILKKKEFRKLIDIMMESNEVIGPKQVSVDAKGRPIHQYLPIESFQDIDLDYETTAYSAKTYFLPYQENLSTFEFDDQDWTQKISYRFQPRIILGLHACDINALLKLDKVLARNRFPSPSPKKGIIRSSYRHRWPAHVCLPSIAAGCFCEGGGSCLGCCRTGTQAGPQNR